MSDVDVIEKPVTSAQAALPAPVAVRTLALTQFRNYEALRLSFSALPVILTGPNGAGKTNLLEAVSLLSPGRGLKRAKLADMDRRHGHHAHAWAISATLDTPLGEAQIGTARDVSGESESDKRIIRIDGRTLRGQAELSDYVSMVWLTPQMDQLFQEGGSARRKFLDRLVYGFDGEHAARVSAFEYAMRERNRLLSQGRTDPHWLDALEARMSESTLAITHARLQAVAHLNEVMRASPLSFPKAHMQLAGLAETLLGEGMTALGAEHALADALRESRCEDAASGRSSHGAHKSELTVMHLGKQMEAALCSTGEQKALLLAIVLAEARAGSIWHGRVPLMLLDEVIAHLDPDKRAELYAEILHTRAQAWMTGTDAALFSGLNDAAQLFAVEDARVAAGGS